MAQDEIKEPVPVEAQVPAGEVVEVTPVDAEPVAQIGSPTAKSPEQIDQDFSALQDSINLIEQLTNNPPEGMSAEEITDTIARNQEHVDTMLSQDAIANDPRAEAMQEAIAGEAVEVAPVDAVAVINEIQNIATKQNVEQQVDAQGNVLLGVDGKPLLGLDGKPLLGADGKPLLDADGNPIIAQGIDVQGIATPEGVPGQLGPEGFAGPQGPGVTGFGPEDALPLQGQGFGTIPGQEFTGPQGIPVGFEPTADMKEFGDSIGVGPNGPTPDQMQQFADQFG